MSKHPAYPEYKDSGVEWLSSIPSSWSITPLKFITSNKVKDGPHETPSFLDEGVPFLSVDSIQNNSLVFQGCRHISASDHYKFSKKCIPKKGDILLGKAASVGKVAYIDTDREFNIWSPLALISPDKRNDSKFVFYCFQSTLLQAQCDLNSNASTQKNLGMKDIDNLFLSVPSLHEQKGIVSFINQETARIDTLIKKKTRFIELLKEKRQAMISHAVTKGLDPNVELKDSGVEWIADVPAHWGVEKLKYSLKIQNNKSTIEPSSLLVALENIESGTGNLIPTDAGYTGDAVEFTAGDILFGKLRPYLSKVHHAIEDGLSFGDILVFRIRRNHYSKFFFYLLISERFIDLVDGSTYGAKMPRANPEFIKNIGLPIPSEKEQMRIVKHLDKHTCKIELLIDKTQQSIRLLKEHRIALISAAVTGKIDVRNYMEKTNNKEVA